MGQSSRPLDALRKAKTIGPTRSTPIVEPHIGPDPHGSETSDPLSALRHAQGIEAAPSSLLDWQPPSAEPGAATWAGSGAPNNAPLSAGRPPARPQTSSAFQPPQGEGDAWGGAPYVPKPSVGSSGLRGLLALQPPSGEGDAWGGGAYTPKTPAAPVATSAQTTGQSLYPYDKRQMGMRVFGSAQDIQIPSEPDGPYSGAMNDPNVMGRANGIIAGSREPSYNAPAPVQAPPIAASTYKRPPVQTPNFGEGMQANNPVQLSALRDQRRGELEDYQAAAPDPRSAALLGLVNQDISGDPYTGDAAQAQQAGVEGRYKSAVEQGYGGTNPIQEANMGARADEQYKVDAPVRAQRVAGEMDIERQRMANEGTLAVANTKAEQAQNFIDSLREMGGQGMSGMSGITVPNQGGHVSFNRPGEVPSALSSEVTKARMAFEQAKQKGDAGALQVAQSTLNQTIENALGREPVSPDIKDFVHKLLANPQFMGKSLDQVIEETQQTAITEDEYQQIQLLLNKYGAM